MAPSSLPAFERENQFYVWSKSRISVIITVAVDMIETMNCRARVFHVGGDAIFMTISIFVLKFKSYPIS